MSSNPDVARAEANRVKRISSFLEICYFFRYFWLDWINLGLHFNQSGQSHENIHISTESRVKKPSLLDQHSPRCFPITVKAFVIGLSLCSICSTFNRTYSRDPILSPKPKYIRSSTKSRPCCTHTCHSTNISDRGRKNSCTFHPLCIIRPWKNISPSYRDVVQTFFLDIPHCWTEIASINQRGIG
jgi:hypothetical protein